MTNLRPLTRSDRHGNRIFLRNQSSQKTSNKIQKVVTNPMPKPRKTLEELDESGTLRHNLSKYRGRIAARMTVSAPIGAAPRHLLAPERAIWSEVVKIAPSAALTKSDRIFLEILVRLIAKMRAGTYKTSDLNALTSLLAKAGMTPADRLRLDLQPIPEPNAQSAEDAAWDALAELD
jgi:hypothetical protein